MIQTTPANPQSASVPTSADGIATNPLPSLVQRDFQWGYEQYLAGIFDEHRGEHVAVLNQKVVGFHREVALLEEQACREQGVTRDRLAIFYID